VVHARNDDGDDDDDDVRQVVKACQEIGSLKDELHQLKSDNQDLAIENRYQLTLF